MVLSTLELALFRCGTLELELFRCGRVVPMEGGGVEEVVDGYGCFGGGRVVEIEDESCIGTERLAGRAAWGRCRCQAGATSEEPVRQRRARRRGRENARPFDSE